MATCAGNTSSSTPFAAIITQRSPENLSVESQAGGRGFLPAAAQSASSSNTSNKVGIWPLARSVRHTTHGPAVIALGAGDGAGWAAPSGAAGPTRASMVTVRPAYAFRGTSTGAGSRKPAVRATKACEATGWPSMRISRIGGGLAAAKVWAAATSQRSVGSMASSRVSRHVVAEDDSATTKRPGDGASSSH